MSLINNINNSYVNNERMKKKCPMCNNRVKLTDIKCKCGKVHCMIHRLPEDHQCEYNICEESNNKLKDNTVYVITDKINIRI